MRRVGLSEIAVIAEPWIINAACGKLIKKFPCRVAILFFQQDTRIASGVIYGEDDD